MCGTEADGTRIKRNGERGDYYSIGQHVWFCTGDKVQSHFQCPLCVKTNFCKNIIKP